MDESGGVRAWAGAGGGGGGAAAVPGSGLWKWAVQMRGTRVGWREGRGERRAGHSWIGRVPGVSQISISARRSSATRSVMA